MSNSVTRTLTAMKKANTSAVLSSKKLSNSVERAAMSGLDGDLRQHVVGAL